MESNESTQQPQSMDIQAAGVHLPGVVNTEHQMFLDVVPPNFPNGCEVVFMRPGELQAAGSIPLAVGSMLIYIPAAQAEQMRGQMNQVIALERAAREKQARNGVGHGG